jgi:hypothetical protein
LIWDAATSHFCEQVVDKATDLGIILDAIPPGCTSFDQICDLIANKPLKQAFKKRYVSWNIRSDPGPGQKSKIYHKDIIGWLEEAIEEVDSNLLSIFRISKAFLAYGQDHCSQDQTASWSILANTKLMGYVSLC